VGTPYPDQPPDPPDLPPDVVASLATYSRLWAEWLENDHRTAELHGHVIAAEQVATLRGWSFMTELFTEWPEWQ
jgi:hypothetical protein